MALTDTKVRSAKPEAKEYSLVDGDGMFLLIHPNGSKYWRFRFRFGGKQHLMAFGVYPETSLADARQKREEARRLVAAGVDPREHKRVVKEEQAKEVITFESVARDWHASNQKWSESHSARVLKSLEDNLFDAIGKPMSENTVNKSLRVMGYDTKVEVCGHGFRTMACSSLIESGLWSKDAVERQMSHQERNSVRAAYIHKAEHLGERRLMLQWWADYLDVNREKGVSPFDFAKIAIGK